jgi:hypothetical protein
VKTEFVPLRGSGEALEKPPRPRTKFYVRHIVPSDAHCFIGRIYDLSIVGLNFDSYAQLAKYPDCKYAMDVNNAVSSLVQRVESLNLVGEMLWPEHLPTNFKKFPVSRYQWLMVATDVFLVRYISIVDCALLLVNEVYESGLKPERCTLANLKRHGIPRQIVDILNGLLDDQGSLRKERNRRVHHGAERAFTLDDQTFRLGSTFERWANGMTGHDRFGRKINIERSFKEGLVGLQREFNRSTRKLKRQLDRLYEELWDEFEDRFGPRISAATHGLNAGASAATRAKAEAEKS